MILSTISGLDPDRLPAHVQDCIGHANALLVDRLIDLDEVQVHVDDERNPGEAWLEVWHRGKGPGGGVWCHTPGARVAPDATVVGVGYLRDSADVWQDCGPVVLMSTGQWIVPRSSKGFGVLEVRKNGQTVRLPTVQCDE